MKFSTMMGIIAAAVLMVGCASNDEQPRATGAYEEATAKTPTLKCQSGYVLSCEARKVGRIRFGRMGNNNLDSCSCEYFQGMPEQSPLPGIQ